MKQLYPNGDPAILENYNQEHISLNRCSSETNKQQLNVQRIPCGNCIKAMTSINWRNFPLFSKSNLKVLYTTFMIYPHIQPEELL